MAIALRENDGASKGITVRAHAHRDTRLDLEPLLTIQLLGDIVQWADAIWIEATGKRRDGVNFVCYPVAVIEDKVDMEVGLKRMPDPPKHEKSDGYRKFQDVV